MSDPTYEAIEDLRRHQFKQIRHATADVLGVLALSIFAATGVLLALILVLWVNSSDSDALRYLLALLPLLAAATTLAVYAARVRRSAYDTRL